MIDNAINKIKSQGWQAFCSHETDIAEAWKNVILTHSKDFERLTRVEQDACIRAYVRHDWHAVSQNKIDTLIGLAEGSVSKSQTAASSQDATVAPPAKTPSVMMLSRCGFSGCRANA